MSDETTRNNWKYTISSQNSQRSNNTCLIIGGAGCLSIILLIIIVVALMYSGAKTVVSTLVDQFTDAQPVPLPEVTLDQNQIDSALKRWDDFKNALVQDQPAEVLTLTSDDVNALINHHPDWTVLKGQAHVSFAGSNLEAQVSVSLEPFTVIPLFGKYVKGRYFNGKATFDVFVRNGLLFLTVQRAEVKGKEIPPEAVAELRQKNLAEDVRKNPNTAAILDRVERLEIKDGKAVIVPKKVLGGAESVSPAESTPTPEESVAAGQPALN